MSELSTIEIFKLLPSRCRRASIVVLNCAGSSNLSIKRDLCHFPLSILTLILLYETVKGLTTVATFYSCMSHLLRRCGHFRWNYSCFNLKFSFKSFKNVEL